MEAVSTGYGSSGSFQNEKGRAIQEKRFRYLIISTWGGHSGMIGGSFNWKINGTDDPGELMDRAILSSVGFVFDTHAGELLQHEGLARQYIEALTPDEKAKLMEEVLIKHVLGQ